MPFLSCLAALTRNSSSIMNKSSLYGESGPHCRLLDLGGKTFSISPLIAVGLGHTAFTEVCSFFTQTVKGSYHERMLYFVMKDVYLFLHLLKWLCSFSFTLLT